MVADTREFSIYFRIFKVRYVNDEIIIHHSCRFMHTKCSYIIYTSTYHYTVLFSVFCGGLQFKAASKDLTPSNRLVRWLVGILLRRPHHSGEKLCNSPRWLHLIHPDLSRCGIIIKLARIISWKLENFKFLQWFVVISWILRPHCASFKVPAKMSVHVIKCRPETTSQFHESRCTIYYPFDASLVRYLPQKMTN